MYEVYRGYVCVMQVSLGFMVMCVCLFFVGQQYCSGIVGQWGGVGGGECVMFGNFVEGWFQCCQFFQ